MTVQSLRKRLFERFILQRLGEWWASLFLLLVTLPLMADGMITFSDLAFGMVSDNYLNLVMVQPSTVTLDHAVLYAVLVIQLGWAAVCSQSNLCHIFRVSVFIWFIDATFVGSSRYPHWQLWYLYWLHLLCF